MNYGICAKLLMDSSDDGLISRLCISDTGVLLAFGWGQYGQVILVYCNNYIERSWSDTDIC